MNILKKTLQLKHHSGFKKYFANTSWVLGERILHLAVSLFISIYVARYLGPERYGLLSYALSFVWLFSALAHLGLDDILVQELVQHREKRKDLLGTVFWLKICGTAIMGISITTVLQFMAEDKQTYWIIIIIAFGFLFQSTNVIELYFRAQVQSKFAVRVQVVQLFITSLFKIYLVWSKADLVCSGINAGSGCCCFTVFDHVPLENRVVPFFLLSVETGKEIIKKSMAADFCRLGCFIVYEN